MSHCEFEICQSRGWHCVIASEAVACNASNPGVPLLTQPSDNILEKVEDPSSDWIHAPYMGDLDENPGSCSQAGILGMNHKMKDP